MKSLSSKPGWKKAELESFGQVELPHRDRPLEDGDLADLAAADDVHQQPKLAPVVLPLRFLELVDRLGNRRLDSAAGGHRASLPAGQRGARTRRRRNASGLFGKVLLVADAVA